MRSCILSFYILACAALGAQPATTGDGEDPDALYAQRSDLASAQRASQIWAERVAREPQALDAAWKLARVSYWLGGHARQQDRRGYLEAGIEAGRKAARLKPDGPEGYFWLAANMGALAESSGPLTGLKYRKPIKEALETVLRLDPVFQDGSADRALGRWYFKVPGLFGGNKKRAEEHLRASLKYDPNSTVSHFFLAEVLLDGGRKSEARAELQSVLDAPLNPDWTPEDQEFKEKARALLQETSR